MPISFQISDFRDQCHSNFLTEERSRMGWIQTNRLFAQSRWNTSTRSTFAWHHLSRLSHQRSKSIAYAGYRGVTGVWRIRLSIEQGASYTKIWKRAVYLTDGRDEMNFYLSNLKSASLFHIEVGVLLSTNLFDTICPPLPTHQLSLTRNARRRAFFWPLLPPLDTHHRRSNAR